MPTITESTHKQYLSKANQALRSFLEQHPDIDMSTREGRDAFADWIAYQSHEQKWTRSTWRYMRASVCYAVAQDLGEKEAQWMYQQLNAHERRYQILFGGHPSRTVRPYKMREAPDAQLRKLAAEMESVSSFYSRLGGRWLRANLLLGLRPIEWGNMTFDPERRTVTVANAKNTNGRAHGETRTLDLSDLSEEQWNLVVSVHEEWKRLLSIRDHEYVMGQIRVAIGHAKRRLAKQGERIGNISPYSTRHQFVANVRASGLPPEEIAALLGHANTDSHRAHYGLRSKGDRHAPHAKATAEDVARVVVGKRTLMATQNLETLRQRFGLK